jgi:signal transduction histidine kinase
MFYKYYADTSSLGINVHSSSFAFYSILLSGAVVIAFLKPKQESQDLSDEKINYLEYRINDYRDELYQALELKYEFLRNLQHEAHTPITGITSMAQVIDDIYDKLPEEKRRQAIHEIALNAERLESYVNNLIDLSKLSSLKYDIQMKDVNLSDLINSKLAKCRKFYVPEKLKEAQEFIIEVEPNIVMFCDEHYMGRSIENIIINAIQYCKSGKITIKLTKIKNEIEFSVRDEGIGIPKEYMKDLFGAFTTSSKTKTPAGGRGVGLALAKKVIDLHKGAITVESDGESWTRVVCVL